MIKNKNRVYNTILAIGLIIYYFFYGISAIPKYLNGISIIPTNLYVYVLIVLNILLVLFLVSTPSILKEKKYYFSFGIFLLVLCLLLISLTYLPEYPEAVVNANESYTAIQYFKTFLLFTISPGFFLMLFGINIDEIQKLYNKIFFRKIILVLFFLYFLLLIYAQFKQGHSLIEQVFKGKGANSYYLNVGDAVTIIGILTMYTCRNSKFLLIIPCITIWELFIIGSRTSLASFVFALCVIASINISRDFFEITLLKVIKGISMVVLLFILGIIFLPKISSILNNPDNELARMLVLFQGAGSIGNDGSMVVRNYLEKKNTEDLKNIWITGKVFREFVIWQHIGWYTHNIKSYLNQFGIVTFSLIIINLFKGCYYAVKRIVLNQSYNKELGLLLFSAWILSAFFSRSYVYPLTWMLIGISPQLYLNQKKDMEKYE